MKIHQLLSGVGVAITNEEQQFISRHDNNVRLSSLDDHDVWLAQSLVRKGVYSISKDSSTLSKNINETSN
jgi:hypothetical protein